MKITSLLLVLSVVGVAMTANIATISAPKPAPMPASAPKPTTATVAPSSTSPVTITTSIVANGATGTAYISAPVIETIPMVGAPRDASLSEVCLARVLQAGFFKLPQLATNQVGFTSFTTQVTTGTSYHFDFVAPTFTAQISGRCSFTDNSAIIDVATYTPIAPVKITVKPLGKP